MRCSSSHCVILTLSALSAFGWPRPAGALFGGVSCPPIVHDPTNSIQLAASLGNLSTQIEQHLAKIEQMRKTLEDLADLDIPSMEDAFGHVEDALGAAQFGQPDLSALPSVIDGTITDEQAVHHHQEAAAAVREQTEQLTAAVDKVEDDRAAVEVRVAGIVAASNSAPGEKAAAQAQNDLLAVLSAEQAKLTALRAMRGRLTELQAAREQARAAVNLALRRRHLESVEEPPVSSAPSVILFPEHQP